MAQNKNSFSADIKFYEAGFSLIELLVVLAIFAVIMGLMLVNFAGLRAGRDLQLAQNEFISNVRKVQSYALSSRTLTGGQAVQYYLLKFNRATPDRYTLEALYDVSTSPKLASNIETFLLPQGVTFSPATPFTIDRPPFQTGGAPSDSGDVMPANNNLNNCVLLAFKLPFGTSIVNGGLDNLNANNSGCTFLNFNNDDYTKIKDFVGNSWTNTASSNSILTLYLSYKGSALTKSVVINGLTQAVSAGQ